VHKTSIGAPRFSLNLWSISLIFSDAKVTPVLSEAHIYRLYDQGAERVLRLVRQLECRIAEMEALLTRTPQPVIALLSKELTTVKRTLAYKTQELVEQRQLNHQLLLRIRELEADVERPSAPVARDSHNSNLPPSLDPPWRKVPRTRSLRKKSGRQVGGQHGHRGTTLRQVAHPDQSIVHAPQSCAACGTSLHDAAVVAITRRQVFDLREGRISVVEHRAQTRRCPDCGMTTKASFPLGVRAPVQYGTGVLARATYLNLYQLLPVARTCETMRDLFGCLISQASVQRAGRLCSGKLVRTEQRIKAAVRDSPVIGADETGLRVAGAGAWIHVARTDELTHYGYDRRRGKAAMDEIGILPQFTGTLVRDGWSSYKWYERCHHSLCNATCCVISSLLKRPTRHKKHGQLRLPGCS
jgi:transposase